MQQDQVKKTWLPADVVIPPPPHPRLAHTAKHPPSTHGDEKDYIVDGWLLSVMGEGGYQIPMREMAGQVSEMGG
jgi:hypothetical protein